MGVPAFARAAFRHTLVYHLWRRHRHRRFLNVELPRLESVTLHGVTLDVRGLSTRLKEAMLSEVYEHAEVRLCREILTPEDRVVEIGSAIGFIGLFNLGVLGVARHASVEANPRTAERLRANYERNGRRPELLVAALAGEDGPVRFGVGDDFWTDSLVGASGETAREFVTVEGCRLETLLTRFAFEPSALVIDVEGGESCLRGRPIPESVRKIVVEMHPAVLGSEEVFGLLNDWMNQGFRVRAQCENSFALVRGGEIRSSR